ncbi:hypothetical protein C0J52_16649 [Blattella germanica]|nr:hypothetical protein C0J52_16649 [Blattella germanica]
MPIMVFYSSYCYIYTHRMIQKSRDIGQLRYLCRYRKKKKKKRFNHGVNCCDVRFSI